MKAKFKVHSEQQLYLPSLLSPLCSDDSKLFISSCTCSYFRPQGFLHAVSSCWTVLLLFPFIIPDSALMEVPQSSGHSLMIPRPCPFAFHNAIVYTDIISPLVCELLQGYIMCDSSLFPAPLVLSTLFYYKT